VYGRVIWTSDGVYGRVIWTSDGVYGRVIWTSDGVYGRVIIIKTNLNYIQYQSYLNRLLYFMVF